MSNIPEKFFDKVKELYTTYEKVKLAIIYTENFDPKRELYIAPINQLRSTLDHLFKAVAHTDDIDYELKEAQEHLDRAGFDAFEILASNLGIIIYDKLKNYSTETLTAVFPDYYKTIRPKIVDIQTKLGEIRKSKKNSLNGINVSFTSYFEQIEILLEFNKIVDCTIPAIEEYQKKRRRERLFNFIITGILSAVISGLIVYFITK